MIYLAILGGFVAVAIGAREMARGLDAGDDGCGQFLAGMIAAMLGTALCAVFALRAFV